MPLLLGPWQTFPVVSPGWVPAGAQQHHWSMRGAGLMLQRVAEWCARLRPVHRALASCHFAPAVLLAAETQIMLAANHPDWQFAAGLSAVQSPWVAPQATFGIVFALASARGAPPGPGHYIHARGR